MRNKASIHSFVKFRIIYLFAGLLTKNVHAMSDIKSRITTIIVDKLGVDASAVKPEADFSNDLGADSLDKVEFIMDVEKEFGISIPDEEAEKLQTVGEAIAYLEKNV
jgi:acyl carrier protein